MKKSGLLSCQVVLGMGETHVSEAKRYPLLIDGCFKGVE